MKVLSTTTVAIIAGASSAGAFAPGAARTRASTCSSSSSRLQMNQVPFFASETEEKEEAATEVEEVAAAPAPVEPVSTVDTVAEALADAARVEAENAKLDALSTEEEIELMVANEMSKTKKASKLKNAAAGVEYAPWMRISEADEEKIRVVMKERTEARRKRQEQARDVTGNLFRDSQAQELSGTGLTYKLFDGDVELSWATKSERNTKGFTIKRRRAKTDEFTTLVSYEDYGPLASKGDEGGIYKYLDTTAGPGGWVYRITEEDTFGGSADICQALVEVETEEEQQAALFAAAGFGLFAVLAVVGGIMVDPMGGY
ncbi:hypothetical protein THAOC_15587 [Thalassiosira oceanica]|uniref:Uncharacterized protein n=2 Tax=Thalassiosira oceanica TaxID=159749 RepID=K0SEJ7_THAOC|nr:hypothetical protein THAOC_15587 [Thalassiosira oceanica]|mmetsp:Transcript_26183/g.62216  ORF Transcript_26183/g.62216 Transcript_26183/m.62216 type:complete len:316 (-) Transcript_26183:67-1014(-)|eukprot:EJK63740.1 hypothetical protein THAOC_15587 [Thalassiosira oceanica]